MIIFVKVLGIHENSTPGACENNVYDNKYSELAGDQQNKLLESLYDEIQNEEMQYDELPINEEAQYETSYYNDAFQMEHIQQQSTIEVKTIYLNKQLTLCGGRRYDVSPLSEN